MTPTWSARRARQPRSVATPFGYLFPTTGGVKANPNVGVVRYIFWNTDSNYHGLNVNLDKKFAHGFQFQLAYTFSKSQDDDSQTIAGDTFANGINSPDLVAAESVLRPIGLQRHAHAFPQRPVHDSDAKIVERLHEGSAGRLGTGRHSWPTTAGLRPRSPIPAILWA